MTIAEAIKANPTFSNQQIADLVGSNRATVQVKRSKIKKRLARLEEIRELNPAIVTAAEKIGIDATQIKHGWVKTNGDDETPGYSFFIKDNTTMSYEEVADAIIDKMNSHSPNYNAPDYKISQDPHLFVYDPADIHINKLASAYETGEAYNSQIAVKRCREGLRGLLNKAHGYHFDKILFILGNDMLNADGPSNATTKGTQQQTDLLWFDAWVMAFDIFVEQIETCANIAPVIVNFNPSNHDVASGFFLAQSLKSFFRLDKRVTFDVSPAHRKYFRYGKNLIASTHGDAAKMDKLPLLMATEAKENWSLTKHYYVYMHHIHHKESKDFGPVCVESLRSPSSADGWHHRNGFQHAPKAIEAFIHHPEFGQIARLTHIF